MEFEVFQSAIMELIRFQLSKEFLFPRLVLRRPVLSSLLRAIYFMHRSIGPQVHHAKAGILFDKNTGKDFNVLNLVWKGILGQKMQLPCTQRLVIYSSSSFLTAGNCLQKKWRKLWKEGTWNGILMNLSTKQISRRKGFQRPQSWDKIAISPHSKACYLILSIRLDRWRSWKTLFVFVFLVVFCN